MLGPGNEEEALKALRAYPQGLQIGGGIKPENAEYFLEQGTSHVIVTSYVFKDGKINFENLDKLVSVVGTNRLVLDLSCRERDGTYLVVTDRWQNFTDFEVTPERLGNGKLDFTVGSALDIFGGKSLTYREVVDWKPE